LIGVPSVFFGGGEYGGGCSEITSDVMTIRGFTMLEVALGTGDDRAVEGPEEDSAMLSIRGEGVRRGIGSLTMGVWNGPSSRFGVRYRFGFEFGFWVCFGWGLSSTLFHHSSMRLSLGDSKVCFKAVVKVSLLSMKGVTT
jgi:hypothetical protein